MRVGLTTQRIDATPTLVAATAASVSGPLKTTETGLRLSAVVDQLDYANFPTSGYRWLGQASLGQGSDAGRFQQIEATGTVVRTFGAHSWSLYGAARGASQQQVNTIGRYELGGFHQLSGYRDGQLLGDYVLFSRLSWYMRLPGQPVVVRAYFVGATLEAGNAWSSRKELRAGSLRSAMSLFIGADTGLGPLYLALTHAPRGQIGVVLFIGRP